MPHLPILGLPVYGILIASGFLAGWWIAGRLAPRVGLETAVVRDMVVVAALVGLVGAKALLVLVEPSILDAPPLEAVLSLLTQAGVFYGGLLAAIGTVLWRCHVLRLSPHDVGDACAPALAIGHAFGRLGCFMAGCCWGERCDLPWAVRFTDPDAMVVVWHPWLRGAGLHPTQLYEIAGNLVLAALAAWLVFRRPFRGAAWWAYLAGYGAFRFFIEEFRGDPRGELWGFSTSQVVGAGAGVVGLTFFVVQALRPAARVGPSGETPASADEPPEADGAVRSAPGAKDASGLP